jgi:hypothetical protein
MGLAHYKGAFISFFSKDMCISSNGNCFLLLELAAGEMRPIAPVARAKESLVPMPTGATTKLDHRH